MHERLNDLTRKRLQRELGGRGESRDRASERAREREWMRSRDRTSVREREREID